MKVELAKHSGFCFGVRNALKKTVKLLDSGQERIYSIGDLIHNPHVIMELKKKGLRIVKDLKDIKEGTVVVRAHGFPPSLIDRAKKKGLRLVDATCPFVKKAQAISRSLNDRGYTLIIAGDKDHPETKSLRGFAHGGSHVVAKVSDLKNLNLGRTRKIGLLAQTTQPEANFRAIAARLVKNGQLFEVRIFNTICGATAARQNEAESLAHEVDLMLVVGGKLSQNTKTLAKICKSTGARTYHIEGPDALKPNWLMQEMAVGIISGTSTPEWVIEEVAEKLRERG